MLNKIDFKKRLYISFIFFVTSLFLFSLSVFSFMGKPFDWAIFINYGIASLIVSAYVYAIMHLKLNFAFILFVLGYVFAFAMLVYNSTKDYTGFLEIAGLISWFVIIGLVIVSGLSVEFLMKSRSKNKELLLKTKEMEAEKLLQAQKDAAIDVEYEIVNDSTQEDPEGKSEQDEKRA